MRRRPDINAPTRRGAAVIRALRLATRFACITIAVAAARATPATPAAALQPAADEPGAAPPAAIERLPAGWRAAHCAFVRGVLTLRVVDGQQRTRVLPAFATPAVLQACEAAGFAVAASAPQRRPMAAAPITVPPIGRGSAGGAGASGGTGAGPADGSAPVFAVQAVGGLIGIDARNGSGRRWHCSLSVDWLSGDDTMPRHSSAQLSLQPGQSERVLNLPAPNARLVGSPRWSCSPA